MKNVPDDLLRQLRGRPKDLPAPGDARWGKVARLATGTQREAGRPQHTLTFVQTGIIAPAPVPVAVKLRFSLDGITYTPEVPGTFGGNVIVNLIETIDMKSGPFLESFTLAAGDTQSFCNVLCMGLNLAVTLDAEDAVLFVEVVAAPTLTADCNDIIPPPPTRPTGYSSTTTARYPAETAATYNLAANANRAMLTIVNQSNADLFVHLGVGVTITPGSEFATVVLPGGAVAGCQYDNYTGEVYFRFADDDDTGYALVTEGFFT